jgi:hypothetical protein
MRFLVTRMLALAVGTAVAIPLTVTACSSPSGSAARAKHSPAAVHKTRPQTNCGSSGCAMVRMTRSLPPATLLYGASCSGLRGSWFFNAVEGGGSGTLRPSYALQWSFAAGSASAKPSARVIHVSPTQKATVTLSLTNGKMKLSGVHKPNSKVNATGSLIVRLAGSASSPSLIFVERGLVRAEHRLGLVSPFNAGGHPLVVPVQHVKSLPGC